MHLFLASGGRVALRACRDGMLCLFGCLGRQRCRRDARDRLAVGADRPDGTAKAVAVRLTADPVCLLVLDTRGVALDPDAKLYAEVQSFLVGQAEFSS